MSLVIVQLDVDVGDAALGSGNLTTGDINGGDRVKELLESLSASSCSGTVTTAPVIPSDNEKNWAGSGRGLNGLWKSTDWITGVPTAGSVDKGE